MICIVNAADSVPNRQGRRQANITEYLWGTMNMLPWASYVGMCPWQAMKDQQQRGKQPG